MLLPFLLLPLVLARPIPQFAGIGPWEGEFFGRDPGQEYRHGFTSYPPPLTGDYNPHHPPYQCSGPYNPYGPPPPPYPYDPSLPYGNLGFTPQPQEEPEPEPEPLEPIDLMGVSKEELEKILPPPPPPPTPTRSVAPEAKGPAEGSGPPKKEKKEEEKKKAPADPQPFDFMGGRWGIAGQGKYIDAARGDHRLPTGAEREKDSRRGRFGREMTAVEVEEKEREEEREEEEEEEEEEKKAKPEMPAVEVKQDPEHPLRYNVNIGGIKTGPEDETGPSNFHVFTNEGKKKISSNDMNPETQKYIQEKMIPKMAGRRKKGGSGGGNIFSVFGDGN